MCWTLFLIGVANLITWSVSASSEISKLRILSILWKWPHIRGWLAGKGGKEDGDLQVGLLTFHFCLIFYLKYVRKTSARRDHLYCGWEWVYVWGWWDGKRGKWEEWEEEGGTSEAAVPAQPEREGRGSSVGREIPSGADCDLSICETKSPPSFCLCSSESFRPRHLVWWNLSFFKSQPEETSFKEMLLSYS